MKSSIYVGFSALICLLFTSQVSAIVLLSHYEFDSDLTNAAPLTADNGMVAPDGMFREGTNSATAVTGTPTFVQGVDGLSGSALFLDGVNDWIDITTDGHPGAQTGTNFINFGPGVVSGTVMAWVKVDNPIVNATPRWLMGNANGGDFQSFQVGWNGGQLESVVRAADGPASQFRVEDATHDTSWADGEWHHFAITWHGQFNTGEVLIDGMPVSSSLTSGGSISGSNTQSAWEFPVAIGALNNAETLVGFWQGAIDDLRIYGDPLSASQVQTIIDEVEIATTPDFDSDSDVDGGDFLIWQRGFGSGTTFPEGDANGSMSVDGADLAIWESAFGEGVPAVAAVEVVPEPASIGLMTAALFGCLVWRRRV